MANEFEKLIQSIKKEFGKDIITDANTIIDEKEIIIPISPNINLITGGGVPVGSWMSTVGPCKYGKTTLALTLAANAQKPEYGNRIVFYGDVEGRLKKMNLNGIKGLDLNPEKFKIIRSTKEKILYSADYLNIFCNLLRNYPRCVVIIESISALCDEKIAVGGIGTETRGAGQKLVSQFCDTMANVVRVGQSTVIGIIHLISNTSGYGKHLIEKSGLRWGYQSDVKLVAKSREFVLDSGGKTIGQKVKWICEHSALGPPNGETDSYIRYGIGIDCEAELIDICETLGIVEKGGAWYSIDTDKIKFGTSKEVLKAQGKNNLRDLFVETEGLSAHLEKLVYKILK